jgi:apolipoprotein N-acyltransferase
LSAIAKFIARFPKSHFVFGATTYSLYNTRAPISATARNLKQSNLYFDSHNSALQIDTSKRIQIYHKSKLVVGVEKVPYPNMLKFLEKPLEKLGGSFASHATQDFREVFESTDKKNRIAPVICYESDYGEFVTGYIKNGANLIFIITNDGWWGNTPGYRQHFSYARLRAIETRRDIARSANTGISSIINQRGDAIKSLNWGIKGALSGELNSNSDLTFYVRHGDYLGRLACFISGVVALFTVIIFITKRRR